MWLVVSRCVVVISCAKGEGACLRRNVTTRVDRLIGLFFLRVGLVFVEPETKIFTQRDLLPHIFISVKRKMLPD